MNATCKLALDFNGEENLLVVIKGTYNIPKAGEELNLADLQLPFARQNIFTGDPCFSSLKYGSDFVLVKPYCDVILHGKAYAPKRKPVKKLRVRLAVSTIDKTFNVVGNRSWLNIFNIVDTLYPDSFVEMPISYDHAFGGVDSSHPDPAKHTSYTPNPVGVGFVKYPQNLKAKPLPNTEEIDNPVTKPGGKYKPMSFGPIAPSWNPRYKFCGSYDETWLDERYRFLSSDFDSRYYQIAPIDQQMAYPEGGELITLENLTPEGITRIRLPNLNMPVEFELKSNQIIYQHAVVDTIYIEPDKKLVTLTWRTSIPLVSNITEVDQVIVGQWRKMVRFPNKLPKKYYPPLYMAYSSQNVKLAEEV